MFSFDFTTRLCALCSCGVYWSTCIAVLSLVSPLPLSSHVFVIVLTSTTNVHSGRPLSGSIYMLKYLHRLFGAAYSSDDCGDGPPSFPCVHCSSDTTPFSSLGFLAEHYRRHHSRADSAQAIAAQPRLVSCSLCQALYAGSAAMVNHSKRCRGHLPDRNVTEVPARRQDQPPAPADIDYDDLRLAPPSPNAAPDEIPGQVRAAQCVRRKPIYSVVPSLLELCRELLSRHLTALLTASDTPAGVSTEDVYVLNSLPGYLQDMTGTSNLRRTKRHLHALLDPQTPLGRRPAPIDTTRPPRRNAPPTADTPQLPLRRITQLVDAGCLSRAVRLVESSASHSGLAQAGPDTADALRQLFPAGTLDDQLPLAGEAATEPLMISQDLVDSALTALPAQSAAGFSGWTYDLIQALSTGPSAAAVHLRSLIRSFANLYLRGRAGPSMAWQMDRLVPLTKRGGGIRPIVIGEAWPRIVSRMASRALAPTLAPILLPFQWGIGSQAGPEVVAHAAHMFESVVECHRDMAVQTVDFRNAFNSIRRRPIHLAVERWAPALLPWYRWAYGTSSQLFFADGNLATTCESGVRQGDPLACILFCLGIQSLLQDLQLRFPQLTLMADLDDLTAFGPLADMSAFMRDVSSAASEIGLTVHTEKSRAWISPDTAAPSTLAVTTRGHKLMGTFVGTREFQSEATELALEEYASTLAVLSTLDPTLAFPLLQSCVNTRPVYLARTTAPWISGPLLPGFDARVDQALLRIAGSAAAELPPPARLIRALPHRDGGLGVPRLASIGEPAWVASFTNSVAILCEHLPGFVLGCTTAETAHMHDDAFLIVKQSIPDLFRSDVAALHALRPTFWPTSPDESAPRAPTPSQKTLCQSITAANVAQLATILSDDPIGQAWHLSCSYRGSGAWLTPGPRPASRRLPADAFKDNLSLRLLLPAAWAPPGHFVACQHCAPYPDDPEQVADYRFHGLNCRRGQGARTTRHDEVRNVLVRGLQRLFGRQAVLVEPRLGPNLCEPDITLTTGAGVVHLDVSIVNPASDSYRHLHCDTTPLAVATHWEQRKAARYRDTLTSLGLDDTALVPFVVEATGRLGVAATSFLDSLALRPGIRAEVNMAATLRATTTEIQHRILIGNSVSTSRARAEARVI